VSCNCASVQQRSQRRFKHRHVHCHAVRGDGRHHSDPGASAGQTVRSTARQTTVAGCRSSRHSAVRRVSERQCRHCRSSSLLRKISRILSILTRYRFGAILVLLVRYSANTSSSHKGSITLTYVNRFSQFVADIPQ